MCWADMKFETYAGEDREIVKTILSFNGNNVTNSRKWRR